MYDKGDTGMTDPYTVYNALIDIMCSRCNPKTFRRCKDQDEDKRCQTMIRCIKFVLVVDDEKYPTELIKEPKTGMFGGMK